jgi:multiple sugar transport system substrate-binding protein
LGAQAITRRAAAQAVARRSNVLQSAVGEAGGRDAGAAGMSMLRGMTWSHPRGYDPLAACAKLWRTQSGLEVIWERRSLQDFESFPVEDLARRYDLIVIDHPHVGQVAREGCLLPLERPALQVLAAQSVGPSFESYRWDGRILALPIDAAAQVQAWRPDRTGAPAATWDEVLELARAGRVLCPLLPPHSLMAFFTLAANLGHPCATTPGPLIEPATGAAAYAHLRALTSHLDAACFAMDPIAVFEVMAEAGSPIACAPLIYGYVSYALAGFRAARLSFAGIPAAGAHGPIGATLGGTGIAVSSRSSLPQAAVDFAFWIASAEVQRGPYAAAGGQPGNAVAWQDPALDHAAGGFFSATRATLERAWVRPRHDGYMRFQAAASLRLNAALRAGDDADLLLKDLDRLFAQSFTA